MKLQYKIPIILVSLSIIFLFPISYLYMEKNERMILKDELHNLKHFATDASLHLDSILKNKANLAITISSAPLLNNRIIDSNLKYSQMSKEKRENKISELNNKWKDSNSTDDPFILNYTNNQVANYLKLQQKNFPDTYGEIFLTNKYGALIASTAKLSTFAHKHKYWWKKSYANADGKIFFDDRGYDKSVKGYVIGVVLPIKHNNEVIGILKCNINIKKLLYSVINSYRKENNGKLQIVRSQGLVVASEGVNPLTVQLNEQYVKYLNSEDMESKIITINGERQLVACSIIGLTKDSKEYSFGGKHKTYSKIYGNKGEAWHVVVSKSVKQVTNRPDHNINYVILTAIILIITIAIVSTLVGRFVARPIEELSNIVQTLGGDDLKIRSEITSSDEIGILAKSFNKMADTLEIRRHILNQSNNLLKNIMNTIPSRIFWKDMQGKYLGANNAFLQDAKLEKKEDIIGKSDLDLIWGKTTAKLYMEDDKLVMNSGEPKLQYKESIITENGDLMWVITSKVPLKDEDNNTIGILGVFEDITQMVINEKKIEEQQYHLIQQSKMASMGEMIGNIAHQWRQPLSSISSAAIGIRTKLLSNKFDLSQQEGQKECQNFLYKKLDSISDYIEYLSNTIDDFRNFFKPHNTKQESNVSKLIHKACAIVGASLNDKYIRLIEELDQSIFLNTYPSEFAQVIINILNNAKDAVSNIEIEDDRLIFVELLKENNSVVIKIKDSGGGVDEKILSKIFDPYFTTKHQTQGTGLGLYMSYKIITENIGGAIKVENIFFNYNNKVHKGAQFIIVVPLDKK